MERPRDEDLHGADPDFAAVTCPACGADRPRVVSLFGGAASEVLFQCGRCRTCFNWVKWNGRLPPTARRRQEGEGA